MHICGKFYLTRNSLHIHFVFIAILKIKIIFFICFKCLVMFLEKVDKRRYRLKDHITGNHLGNETHTCVLCMKTYRNKNSLTNHMSVYHNKKQ